MFVFLQPYEQVLLNNGFSQRPRKIYLYYSNASRDLWFCRVLTLRVPGVYYRQFWQNFQSACGWTCMCAHVGVRLAAILLLMGHETTFSMSSAQEPLLQVVTWVLNSGHRQLQHLSGVSELQHGVIFGYWKPWTRTDQCFNFTSSPGLDFIKVTWHINCAVLLSVFLH